MAIRYSRIKKPIHRGTEEKPSGQHQDSEALRALALTPERKSCLFCLLELYHYMRYSNVLIWNLKIENTGLTSLFWELNEKIIQIKHRGRYIANAELMVVTIINLLFLLLLLKCTHVTMGFPDILIPISRSFYPCFKLYLRGGTLLVTSGTPSHHWLIHIVPLHKVPKDLSLGWQTPKTVFMLWQAKKLITYTLTCMAKCLCTRQEFHKHTDG